MSRGRDPIDVQVGAHLRRARVDAGLTQADIAPAVGLSRASIANVESGYQPLSVAHLVRAAQALGVEATALLTGVESARPGDVPAPVTLRRAREQVAVARRRYAALARSVDGELERLDQALAKMPGGGR